MTGRKTSRTQTRSLTQKRVGTLTSVISYDTHTHPATKLADICQKLAEADKEDAGLGLTPHQIPASVFVHTGLELEEQQ